MIATVAVWAMLAVAGQVSTTIDRILVVVNGDIITLSDVRAARVLRLVPSGATDQDILQELIDRRLVLAEMRRFQAPAPEPAVLAARRTEWQSRHRTGDLAQLLLVAGVGTSFVDRWLADDLRREAYLDQRFAALDDERRATAIRLWMDGLRARAEIVVRGPV